MLRLLLFSLYIKGLHNSVKYARAYYFADVFKDLFNLFELVKGKQIKSKFKEDRVSDQEN